MIDARKYTHTHTNKTHTLTHTHTHSHTRTLVDKQKSFHHKFVINKGAEIEN